MKTKFTLALAFATLCALADEQKISGPVLGFVYDANTLRVRPIQGISASAFVGAPLDFGVDLAKAVFPARQNYILAQRSDTGEAIVLSPQTGATRKLGVTPGADQIILSPLGDSALFYFSAAKSFQIVTGLPDAPTVSGGANLSTFSNLIAVAISDDGKTILASFPEGLFTFAPDGSQNRINGNSGGLALAFLNHSQDAVVADSNGILLLHDVAGQALWSVLTTQSMSPIAAAISSDNQHAFIADAAAGLLTIDLSSGSTVADACGCLPSGLFPLRGSSLFRLTDLSDKPMTIFDAGGGESRILVIPPVVEGAQ